MDAPAAPSANENRQPIDLGPLLPATEEYLRAKAMLQSMRSAGKQTGLEDTLGNADTGGEVGEAQGGSLYEHLVGVVRLLLEEQPKGALDRFEELSWTVKRQLGSGLGGSAEAMGLPADALRARVKTTRRPDMDNEYCEVEKILLTHPMHKWDQKPDLSIPQQPFAGYENDNEEIIAKLDNFNTLKMLIEQSGIGLDQMETLRIWLSMRRLAEKLPDVQKIKFWGKIYCTGRRASSSNLRASQLANGSGGGANAHNTSATTIGGELHGEPGTQSDFDDSALCLLNANPDQINPLAYYIVEVEAEEQPEEGIPSPWDEWHLPQLQPLAPDANTAKIIEYALKAKRDKLGFGEFHDGHVFRNDDQSGPPMLKPKEVDSVDSAPADPEAAVEDSTPTKPAKSSSVTNSSKKDPYARVLDPASISYLAKNFNISPVACLKGLQKLPKNKWQAAPPLPREERSKGLNRHDYYVCTQLGDAAVWRRLPDVWPEQVVRSRDIRRLFTGDLDAPVQPSPFSGVFPGVEAHLLRASIARITAACWIAPAGMFEVDDEAQIEEDEQPETLVATENFEALELTDLLDSANWAHVRPHINRQGRCNWTTRKRAKAMFKSRLMEGEINMETAEELVRLSSGDQWVQQQLQAAAINAAVAEIDEEANEQPPEIGLDFGLDDEELVEEDDEDGGGGGDAGGAGGGVFEEESEEPPGLLRPLDEDTPIMPIGKVGFFDGRLGDPQVAAAAAIKQAQATYSGRTAAAAVAAIQTRVAQAAAIKPLPSWRISTSTNLLPENCTVAVLGNNRWPGAYTAAKGDTFVNVYVGWGAKSLAASYTVPRPSNVGREFDETLVPMGVLVESVDPTPLEEQALLAEIEERKAKRLAALAAQDEQEEEGEGNEDEGDDEDED